jgi:hypothetical protein
MSVIVEFRVENHVPILSGDRKASAAFLGFAKESGPLAGVIRLTVCCSFWTFRKGGSRRGGIGLAAFDLVEARNEPGPVGDLRASFHCFTSSTASLKFAGCLATGASERREPTIQACLSSFRAETLKFGSF